MFKTINIFCPGIGKKVDLDIYNDPTDVNSPYGPTHESLEKVYYEVLQPMGVKLKIKQIPCNTGSFYEAILKSETKKVVKEGEANSQNLKGSISSAYPETMARKRAFDRAVLTYLGLYGLYSKEECVPEKNNGYRLEQYYDEKELFGTDEENNNNYEEFGFANIEDEPSSDTPEEEVKDIKPIENIKISEFKDFDDKERFKELIKETVPSGKTFGQLYILKGKKRINDETLKKEFDGTDGLYELYVEFAKLAVCIYSTTEPDDRKGFWEMFK